jgi:catechol 2,3-dioxygenase-like lactoylglutathione lyase family enzyme
MDGFGLAQVALNTADMAGTLRLYAEVLGFQDAGGHPSWGDVAAVQGLPADSHWLCWWLVGPRPFFQLEVFHHSQPRQRPQPADWRPSDHGWGRYGLAVDDFDRVVAGLERWGIPVIGSSGEAGRRRLAFRDPHVGVIVEVREGAAGSGPAVLYAAISVPDIGEARRRYQEVLGAQILPLERLHTPEDEALWGLPGVEREGFVVPVGEAFLEVVSYPSGRPRPADHRIIDQGIMNVALGSRDVAAVLALISRVQAAGLKANKAFITQRAGGIYVVEPGVELELMGIPEELDAAVGFKAIGPFASQRSMRDRA